MNAHARFQNGYVPNFVQNNVIIPYTRNPTARKSTLRAKPEIARLAIAIFLRKSQEAITQRMWAGVKTEASIHIIVDLATTILDSVYLILPTSRHETVPIVLKGCPSGNRTVHRCQTFDIFSTRGGYQNEHSAAVFGRLHIFKSS